MCRYLQHLLVLTAAGLHPVSRFHLLQGIVAYLVSPFWALFLLLGVAAYLQSAGSIGAAGPLAAGQSGEAERGLAVLSGTLLILIAPKLIGAANLACAHGLERSADRIKLLASALFEIILMSIIAPILMVQQTTAVLRVFLGIDGGWCAQRREVPDRPWIMYFRFHAAETALGAALVICIVAGLLTNWLWPVAVGLLLAAPLSRLSSAVMSNGREQPLVFATPEDVGQPAIIARSLNNAQRIADRMEAAPAPPDMLQAAE